MTVEKLAEEKANECFPNGTAGDTHFDYLQELRREGFEEGFIEGYKAASSNTVAPVDNIVESEEKDARFFADEVFVMIGENFPIPSWVVDFAEKYYEWKHKEQTKEVSTEKKIPPKPQMNHWGASAADYEQYRKDLNEWEEKYGNQSTNLK